MINSMRDVMGLRDKIVNSCKPAFMENRSQNEDNKEDLRTSISSTIMPIAPVTKNVTVVS
jgi:hypothetical protein